MSIESIYTGMLKVVNTLDKDNIEESKAKLTSLASSCESLLATHITKYKLYSFYFKNKEDYDKAMIWVGETKPLGLAKIDKGFEVRLSDTRGKLWVKTLKMCFNARFTVRRPTKIKLIESINSIYHDIVFSIENSAKVAKKHKDWYNDFNSLNEMLFEEYIDAKTFKVVANRCLKHKHLMMEDCKRDMLLFLVKGLR